MHLELLLVLVAAVADAQPHVRRDAPPLPAGWHTLDAAVAEDQQLTLRFSLRSERGPEELRRIARSVSDPRSSSYGHYLTSAQVQTLTAPRATDVAALYRWLKAPGMITDHGDIVQVELATAEAGAMLQTTFRHVVNARTGQRAVYAGDVWLPADVHAAVSVIYGLHGLPLPPQQRGSPTSRPTSLRSSHSENITPTILRSTYGISGVSVSGMGRNRQAVAEFQGQALNASDLHGFFHRFMPGSQVKEAEISRFVGQGAIGSAGVESMLDAEYIMGLAPGIATEFWYWGGQDFCGDLKNWTTAVLASGDAAPLVHSVSYGFQGNMSILGCAEAEVNDIDDDFAKLAAKGITVIFASGDSGSACQSVCSGDHTIMDTAVQGSLLFNLDIQNESLCCGAADLPHVGGWTWTFNETMPLYSKCEIYQNVTGTVAKKGSVSGGAAVGIKSLELFPSWPASSQWVTAVGATRFEAYGVGGPEMATDRFGSGGGFSRMFDVFEDQAAAVKAYIKAEFPVLPPSSLFPAGGRATPDVAALGEGYQVVVNGSVITVGGTSASAPAFAAMISLLNEARLRAGKTAMGYLNPWLYQHADAFTDITRGTNAIGRDGAALSYGFNCTKGWDPVTGLGTPIFGKLLNAAMSPKAGDRAEESFVV